MTERTHQSPGERPARPRNTEIDGLKVLRFAGFDWAADEIERLRADLAHLADDLAAALATAIDLLEADDDIGVLNEIRGPLARYRETRP